MKIDERQSIVRIEPEILQNLVKEVKETLATGISMGRPAQRMFTSGNLWMIHRNARTAQSRFSG